MLPNQEFEELHLYIDAIEDTSPKDVEVVQTQEHEYDFEVDFTINDAIFKL